MHTNVDMDSPPRLRSRFYAPKDSIQRHDYQTKDFITLWGFSSVAVPECTFHLRPSYHKETPEETARHEAFTKAMLDDDVESVRSYLATSSATNPFRWTNQFTFCNPHTSKYEVFTLFMPFYYVYECRSRAMFQAFLENGMNPMDIIYLFSRDEGWTSYYKVYALPVVYALWKRHMTTLRAIMGQPRKIYYQMQTSNPVTETSTQTNGNIRAEEPPNILRCVSEESNVTHYRMEQQRQVDKKQWNLFCEWRMIEAPWMPNFFPRLRHILYLLRQLYLCMGGRFVPFRIGRPPDYTSFRRYRDTRSLWFYWICAFCIIFNADFQVVDFLLHFRWDNENTFHVLYHWQVVQPEFREANMFAPCARHIPIEQDHYDIARAIHSMHSQYPESKAEGYFSLREHIDYATDQLNAHYTRQDTDRDEIFYFYTNLWCFRAIVKQLEHIAAELKKDTVFRRRLLHSFLHLPLELQEMVVSFRLQYYLRLIERSAWHRLFQHFVFSFLSIDSNSTSSVSSINHVETPV